jgi:hypothetical protein
MELDQAQKAVKLALTGNWKEAVKLNNQILKENPKDVDALNRLARAHAELGNIKKAKSLTEKVLRIDPFNTIALKCLAKWKGGSRGRHPLTKVLGAEAFLEEPGKTKLVSLLHLGDSKLLAKLDAGDEVRFSQGPHRLSVLTLDGKYVGRLPDDLSARLRRLTKAGNSYQVLIKSISPEDVKIFVREVKRAEELKDTPSFSSERVDYVSFTPPELVSKKEEIVMETEEEEV